MNAPNRPVPADVDAEEAVLGSILVSWMHPDVNYLALARRLMAPADFYRDRHGWIFQAMIEVAAKGEHVHEIMVAHQLDLNGKLKAAGGAAYLSHLVANTPTPIFIEDYARIVRDCSQARAQIGKAKRLEEDAYQGKQTHLRQPPTRSEDGIGF